MSRRNKHGQSNATPFKIEGLQAVLQTLMTQASRKRTTAASYWIFDANAGPGWNDYVSIDGGIEGSPLVSHFVADEYLAPRVKRRFVFCDWDERAIEQLRGRIKFASTFSPHWRSSFLVCENTDGLKILDGMLQQETTAVRGGCILMDPNGLPTKQFISGLSTFFEKWDFDLFWNSNMSAFRRHNNKSWIEGRGIKDILSLKKHWWLKITTNNMWMHAIGSDANTSYKKAGFFYLTDQTRRKL